MPALNYDFVILKTVNPFNAKVSIVTLGFFILVLCAVCHKAITYLLLYPFFRLLFGTLYPAYASYKTVKSRNNKEYVKWMMYWIVFALFTCAETFTDIFFSWFPFYYEIKIIIVIWLLSPATKGSSILYRKFVHPTLSSKEQEIDEYIAKAKEQSYRQVFDLGSKSMRVLMQTALKSGGGIVNHLRRSYSLSDLSDQIDETDVGEVSITEAHLTRRRRSPHRSSSSSSSQMYFSEIDIRKDSVAHIQSVEDISSGYSSGEPLYPKARGSLVRSGSVGPGRTRVTRVTRSTGIAKKTASNDEYDADDSKAYEPNLTPSNIKTEEADHSIVTKNEKRRSSSSEEDFVDSLDALHEYSLLAKNSSNILRKDNFLSACPVSKSHSFSGVTEREILKNKLKELYDIYSSITNEGQHLSKVQEKPNKSSSDIENMKSVDSDKEHRAGRYNKKMAPSPPNISIDKLGKSPNSSPSPAIKATLTLKPGVIKTLGPSPEESRPQFFSADSPTLRRKNKSKSPISRLMMLPKKMAFWNKDDAVLEDKQTKRFSWNDVFSNGQRLKPISKMQSRSYEELQNKYLSVCDVPLSNSNEPTACFRARKLSASPTMCRKLETIKLEQQDL